MIDPLHLHRLAHWLFRHGVPDLPGLVSRVNYFLTGCDLAPQVKVGQRVRFQHYGAGVIIHMNVEIGDDVWIMPHVVLGQNLRGGCALPVEQIRIVVGKGAMLGAGAKVIASGYLEIGEGASIGANAVVLKSVPPRCLAVGVPARIVQPKPEPHA